MRVTVAVILAMTRRGLLAVAVPALLAMAAVVLATHHGIGVTTDATVYLDAARHLAHGDGFVTSDACGARGLVTVTHFPPLYPWLVSLGVRAGLTAVDAARWLQVLLAGANAGLIAFVVLRRTASPRAAALAGGLAATALGMLEVHTAAWSEPTFLFFAFVGLTLTAAALERPRWTTLVLGAAAIGAAALTRYVGGALIVTVALAHLLLGRQRLARRLLCAAAAGLVAAAPLVGFAARNVVLAGRATDRVADVQLPGLEHLRSLLVIAGSWLVPGAERLPELAAFGVAIVALGVALAAAVTLLGRGGEQRTMLALHRLAIAVYLALLLVSITTFDHGTPLDQRSLVPVLQSSLIIVVVGAARVWSRARRWLRIGLLGGVCAVYGVAAAVAVRHLHATGRGYLAAAWRFDSLFARLAELPADVPTYSNLADAVTFLTGRRACLLPATGALPAGPAAVLYFEDARRFTPRVVGGVADPGPGVAAAARLARAAGLGHEQRERNAVLFTE